MFDLWQPKAFVFDAFSQNLEQILTVIPKFFKIVRTIRFEVRILLPCSRSFDTITAAAE